MGLDIGIFAQTAIFAYIDIFSPVDTFAYIVFSSYRAFLSTIYIFFVKMVLITELFHIL